MVKKNKNLKKSAPTKEQIKLLQKRRFEKSGNRDLWPTREKRLYLKKFFVREKKLVYFFLIFLVIQAILEIFLIFVSHRFLQSGIDLQRLLMVISVGVIIYLISTFITIKSEKTLAIRLINGLRLKWFKIHLSQKPEVNNLDDKSSLIAKVSYHLPLLSSGVTNSLVGFVRCLILILIFFFICLMFGVKLLWFFLFTFFVSITVGLVGFFIARTFIVQEATFYSKIIKLMDFSLSDWRFTKFFKREKRILNDFNELVNLDSYFRVRRDLWLHFSAAFIFVLLIFTSLFFNVYATQIGKFFVTTNLNTKFIVIVILIYFSRLLYECLRVGLYSVPLAFGLSLSVPDKNPHPLSSGAPFLGKELIFKSAKVKFFKKAFYHKKVKFCFNAGGRYLISGKHRTGKTSLARLFTGNAIYGRRAWLIKSDKKRFFYNDFFGHYSGFYHLDPEFSSSRTILEVALGKEKQRITDEDFLRLTERVNANELLRDVFFEREDWRLKTNKVITNSKSNLLLQILYCLEKKPKLITIDNYWLDTSDQEIVKLLDLLDKSLPNSILIYFATKKHQSENYHACYEI
jgi:hypothetical protein